MDIVGLVSEFGFPVVMVVGLGYFVYFVWQTITNKIDPAVENYNYSSYRPVKALRSRYDSIEGKGKHRFKYKTAKREQRCRA